jgi:hypothetical protein
MNNRQPQSDYDEGVQPPPRFLFIAVIGIFILGILGGIAGLIFLSSPGMSTLLEITLLAAPILTIGTIIAIAFLQGRRWAAVVTATWIVVWIIASLATILIYRNVLAPGQRETVKHYLPFMAAFNPPLPPPGSSLPTPVPNDSGSGIDPASLLNAPLTLGGTATPTLESAAPVAPSATPQPTLEATATPTQPPTATPEATQAALVPTPQPAAVVTMGIPPPPVTARLFGFTYIKQTWNNCGPANITMALSYYGWKETMDFAADFLKPDEEDKNVNPWELAAFVNEQTGVRALNRIGGDMQTLKRLIAGGYPVIIETGFMWEGSDWIGHYQTVVGYDDTQQSFYIYDSYLGTGDNNVGMPKSYTEFDDFWENFNRAFITLYKSEEEAAVMQILGALAEPTGAATVAAEAAQAEARANPKNGFAWFNLGSSLTRLGRYDEAAAAFDRARQVNVPWRITLYQFGPFESYFQIGRYSDVLALVDVNLNNGGAYVEESYYWKGKVLAAQGDNAGAAAAFRQALVHNPRFADAQTALQQLPT